MVTCAIRDVPRDVNIPAQHSEICVGYEEEKYLVLSYPFDFVTDPLLVETVYSVIRGGTPEAEPAVVGATAICL